MASLHSFSQAIYVNPMQGDDLAIGNIESPLKSIEAALTKVESYTNIEKIILNPGVYYLDKTVEISIINRFSKQKRFIIEGLLNPDDNDWKPELMPVIINSATPQTNFGFIVSSIAFNIGMSHVTVRGLKFTGRPSPEMPSYPIARQDVKFTDLEVSQCLFVGDNDASYIQAAVISTGSESIIDHCVFYNCANAAVFLWSEQEKKTGNIFRHNIIFGCSSAGVWTTEPDETFSFDFNIVSNCKFAFVKNLGNPKIYHLQNSFILDCENIEGTFQNGAIEKTTNGIIETNIVKTGTLDLVKIVPGKYEVDKKYLHPKINTIGNGFDAGLFKLKK